MAPATLESPPEVEMLNIDDIFVDTEWNCRGKISPQTCIELSKSIKARGLLQPVMVRPMVNGPKPWSLVQGFRRLMACRINKMSQIPAQIRRDLNDIDAAVVNLEENVERTDLDLIQAGTALKNLMSHGLSERQLAEKFNKTSRWVSVRLAAVSMPLPIQDEIRAGMLTQNNVEDLARLKTDEEKYEAVRQIKDAKLRGHGAVRIKDKKAAAIDLTKAKERSRSEMFKLQDHLREQFAFDGQFSNMPDGIKLVQRVLAWASGEISPVDLHNAVAAYAAEQGLEYEKPQEIRDILKNL